MDYELRAADGGCYGGGPAAAFPLDKHGHLRRFSCWRYRLARVHLQLL